MQTGWVRFFKSNEDYNVFFVDVLMACKSFSHLQTPVELYAYTYNLEEGVSGVLNYIESCPQLKVVSLFHDNDSLTSSDSDRLCKWLSATKSLSDFSLKFRYNSTPEECDLLVQT